MKMILTDMIMISLHSTFPLDEIMTGKYREKKIYQATVMSNIDRSHWHVETLFSCWPVLKIVNWLVIHFVRLRLCYWMKFLCRELHQKTVFCGVRWLLVRYHYLVRRKMIENLLCVGVSFTDRRRGPKISFFLILIILT